MPCVVTDGTFFSVRSPAKHIGRAGKDQQRRDAAGAREAEVGILRPYRMFGPDFGGVRRNSLVAVLMRRRARRRVDAEMRMGVDDAGGHPFPAAIDASVAIGHRHALAYRLDPPVADQ